MDWAALFDIEVIEAFDIKVTDAALDSRL